MKIALVQSYIGDAMRSMDRFSTDLANGLLNEGLEISTIRPPLLAGRLVPSGSRWRKWLGYVDKFILFWPTLLLTRMRSDLVHIIDQGAAAFSWGCNPQKTIVTCHDLFAISRHLGLGNQPPLSWSGHILQTVILGGLRRTRHFTTVSSATEAAMRAILGANSSITCIPNAVGDHFRPVPARSAEQLRETLGLRPGAPYVMHVGNNSYYKNRTGVVRIFAELAKAPAFADHVLILAGKRPNPEILAATEASGLADRIAMLVEPDDDQLVALYSGAQALIFPSFEEGFGWPVLEAQACGCLVITTDKEPMRTAAGGSAILIPPDQAEVAARIILDRWPERTRLIDQGLANAGKYRPHAIYARYAEVYRSVFEAR